jgi:hypothetical protein
MATMMSYGTSQNFGEGQETTYDNKEDHRVQEDDKEHHGIQTTMMYEGNNSSGNFWVAV